MSEYDIMSEGLARALLTGFLAEKGWDNLFESDRQLAMKQVQPAISWLQSQKVKFEITPYYYKVTSDKKTWYWNKDAGEFDGTSWDMVKDN